MEVEEAELPEAGIPPADHYQQLRDGGDRAGAVMFLAHALPRVEALAWAGHVVEAAAGTRQLSRTDRQALDHSLRWLGDPNDATRRAAFEASKLAGDRSPERMLATGVFFSGGSISEPDLPPIQPEPGLAGRFAGVAITMAAGRAEDRDAFFDQALDLGEKVAAEGVAALEAA